MDNNNRRSKESENFFTFKKQTECTVLNKCSCQRFWQRLFWLLAPKPPKCVWQIIYILRTQILFQKLMKRKKLAYNNLLIDHTSIHLFHYNKHIQFKTSVIGWLVNELGFTSKRLFVIFYDLTQTRYQRNL